MKSLNKVFLVGRLGADPEMRFTSQGTAITRFRIAVPRGGDAEPDWFSIVTWERLAEVCNEYLRKGRKVIVVGRLQTSTWEDQEGRVRRTTEIVASEVLFLDAPDSGALEEEEDLGSPPADEAFAASAGRPSGGGASPGGGAAAAPAASSAASAGRRSGGGASPSGGAAAPRPGKVVPVPVDEDDMPF